MTTSVIVPWRPGERVRAPQKGDGGTREEIWAWIERRWRCHFPHYQLVTGDAGGATFNRAAARNDAFSKATGDVIIIADADVIFHVDQIQKAMAMIHGYHAQWVIPYRHYEQLSGLDTSIILESDPCATVARPAAPRYTTDQGNAGLMVLTREAWETVGGYDEVFEGWGWEDWAFANALSTLVHPQVRRGDYVLHLRHPPTPSRVVEKRAMKHLYQPYDDAMGDEAKMRALLAERTLR